MNSSVMTEILKMSKFLHADAEADAHNDDNRAMTIL